MAPFRVGITGHQRLDDETAWSWVEATLRSTCRSFGRPLIGISSLAVGADQLFAEVVLELGGALEVVVPFPAYPDRFDSGGRRNYEALLSRAAKVRTLVAAESDEHGYLAAGQAIAMESEVLVAVWNGRRPKGLGGTADVVAFARSLGRQIVHLNPESRTIES